MQKRKIKVFLAALALALLPAASACGPRSGHPAGEAMSPPAGAGAGSEAEDDGIAAAGHECESSDDCDEDLICVDGECMIPKLMR